MTYIRAWMSSKFGQIRPRTTELPAHERLKINGATFFLRMLLVHPILFILTGNDNMHESSEEFGHIGPLTTDLAAIERLKQSHRLIMG